MRIASILSATVLSAVVLSAAQPVQAQTELINIAHFFYGDFDLDREVPLPPRHTGPAPAPAPEVSLQYSLKELAIRKLRPFKDTILIAYRATPDAQIVLATLKAGDPHTAFVFLMGGTVITLADANHDDKWAVKSTTTFVSLSGASKLVGDALYALKSAKPWASRDTAKSWSLDTMGLGAQSITDIALDPEANVYAISSTRKLWFQHRDSSDGAWREILGFDGEALPVALFIDRMGRIFVASNSITQRVLVSTDTGKTWTAVSDGLAENVAKFGDDDKGNVYVVGAVSGAYRLTGLTPPWSLISGGVAALAQVPAREKLFTSVKGDSILYATTRFGVFTSADSGAHWTHAPDDKQTSASAFYSPLVKAGGKYFMSGNLGVYRAAGAASTWEKVFPQGKYAWGINVLASDSAGNLYGNFPIQIDSAVSRFYPAKSADLGDHWDLDTAGQGALAFNSQILDHYVDAQGNQWLGGAGILYRKRPGEAWAKDTAGLGLKGDYIRQVSRNNKKGIVYASTRKANKFQVYSRPLADSTWTEVNADTLLASDGILQSDADGNPLVKALSFPARLWKYDGHWKSVGLPPTASVTNFDQFLADAQGNLWVTGLYGNGGSPKGLWVSSDGGAAWKQVGIDGVPVKFLSSDKDTVFAVTNGDGVYRFTKDSAPIRLAPGAASASGFALEQNHPNPFRGFTHFRFSVPMPGIASLSILDLRGKEIARLASGPVAAGAHSASWVAGVRGGVYFCRLEFRPAAGGPARTLTRKMLALE